MSDSYYWTRLRYHNGLGLAKKHGTSVSLAIPPDLGSGPVHEMDYIPEIGQADVSMQVREPLRRMTTEEVHAADALLDRLTAEIPRNSCRYDEPWKEGRC